ncbi:MAG TPA: zinc-ribbon domain-containing protein [Chloroflexi bacterium]|nr:zinc-ribbon domain-containing protein [Chloroflexota bacterium]
MDIVVVVVIVLMALVALWWIFKPLFAESEEEVEIFSPEDQRLLELEERRDTLYVTIKDLKQNLEDKKITEADFQQLRAELMQQAAIILRQIDQLTGDADLRLNARIDALLTDFQANGNTVDAALVQSARAEILRETKASPKTLCPNCSHPVAPEDTFCTQCGTPLTNLCPHCQNVIAPDDVFCTHCGVRLLEEEVA